MGFVFSFTQQNQASVRQGRCEPIEETSSQLMNTVVSAEKSGSVEPSKPSMGVTLDVPIATIGQQMFPGMQVSSMRIKLMSPREHERAESVAFEVLEELSVELTEREQSQSIIVP